ncbi:hypothetical protein KGF56_003877 [Candida oxycetoniae]|uniref:Protein PAR32 n=1 Tax=Candida oxycetoniae TaxID=497107 RepID=A0AAI9SUY0_9ASCO|nr:uncharacterized protein KGF56_003877 [Candida oxycetoniae]KAI3403289.2 hypothetical protein KGF56_003877 [Candida oxycetoniae]
MTFSTGRGGAGNIHHHHQKTSENNVLSPQLSVHKSPVPLEPGNGNDSSLKKTTSNNGKKIYYSTGRGGAGNIRSTDSEQLSPKLIPQGSNTPHLTTSKISTGRGGFGNMVENTDPQLTRKLQDVDGEELNERSPELQAMNSNRSFSVGRGGFGNVISKSKSRVSQGSASDSDQAVNLYTVSSRGDKHHKKKSSGILTRIKEMFS